VRTRGARCVNTFRQDRRRDGGRCEQGGTHNESKSSHWNRGFGLLRKQIVKSCHEPWHEPLTLTWAQASLKYAESAHQRELSVWGPELTRGSLIECVSRNVVDCR
jgi:hypothetical protein